MKDEKKTYKDYRMQLKLNYSDDSGKAVEQSVLLNPGTDYTAFIKACSKFFEVVAHTYGDDFDNANKAAFEAEQEALAEDTEQLQ